MDKKAILPSRWKEIMKKTPTDEDVFIAVAPKELQGALKEFQVVKIEKEREPRIPPKIDLFIYQLLYTNIVDIYGFSV